MTYQQTAEPILIKTSMEPISNMPFYQDKKSVLKLNEITEIRGNQNVKKHNWETSFLKSVKKGLSAHEGSYQF